MGGRERGDWQITQTTREREPDASQRFGDELNSMKVIQIQRVAADRTDAAAPPQQKDYKVYTNSDGSGVVKFNDGSSVIMDNWTSRRPTEVVDAQGRKTNFGYDAGSTDPSSYRVTDRAGNVLEEGSKGAKDAEFKVKHFANGAEVKDDRAPHIAAIKLTRDGQLDFVTSDGLHHEHQRSGNDLLRDGGGRILREQTPGARLTEYSYEGNGTQPNSFTVADSHGNIVEHGVKGDKGWTVYKPGSGEASLDRQKLEDPAKMARDPVDQVTDVQVNQRNGMRVETHANGDRTWSSDRREYRMNPSGAMEILDKLPDGKERLASFRDAEGVKTSYDYNDKGQLVGETREYPDGTRRALTRQGDTDKWKNSDGKIITCKAEVLGDGSVQMTYPDSKLVLTQCASGAELVKQITPDGHTRLVHTTDTLGREAKYSYDAGGALNKMELSRTSRQGDQPPTKQTLVWEKTGVENGQDVWQTGDHKHKFVGHQTIMEDGSVVREDAKTHVSTKFSIRGVKYDVKKQ